jgi:hypothetical protein
MRRYRERGADRAETESSNIRQQAQGAGERVTQRARERAEEGHATTSDEPLTRDVREYPPEVREQHARRTRENPDVCYTRDPDDRIVP